jgi:Kef-type K+ transport system membrane component KefB
MIRLLFLIILLLLTKGLNSLGISETQSLGHHAAIAFGFLILFGSLAGEYARRINLPSITGYMIAGLICGPDLLAVLDKSVISHLQNIDQLALFFIALTAGAELKWKQISHRLGQISLIAFGQLFLGGGLVLIAYYLLSPLLPFLAPLQPQQVIAAASILALISVATSPATVVAVIVETDSRGPMRDAVLGTTVFMDVLILIAFSLILGFVVPIFSAETSTHSLLNEIWLLFLSVSIGAFVGGLFIIYLRYVGKLLHLVIIAAGLFLVSISADFHLEPLMMAVATGFVIANFSDRGFNFLHHLEEAAQPIFLVFFGLAGAALDLKVLALVWPAALLFVVLRLGGKWLGTTASAKLARADGVVQKYGWMGFIGQAGVSLGFASIVASEIPIVGPPIREIIIAAVVLNQMIGPILFKLGLEKAGETNAGSAD